MKEIIYPVNSRNIIERVNDCTKACMDIENNYRQIKVDVEQIVKTEMERISNDENLKHLVK